MIPRHSLTFDAGKVLSLLISSGAPLHPAEVEEHYADKLGVRAAILVPSVRAGILLSIKSVCSPEKILVGPAYSCSTVHQAMILSGIPARWVDAAPDSFLMPPDAVYSASETGCALVLSELYGISYDREMLKECSGKGLRLRVLDMAMSIPSPERLKELEDRDIALFSFGWGKPMFAGCGGLACCQNVEFAASIRALRDHWCLPESFALRFRNNSALLLRAWGNQRNFYGLSHGRHLYRIYQKIMNKQGNPLQRNGNRSEHGLSPQWTHPMTEVNLRLALQNLYEAPLNAELRRKQAEIYAKCLVESGLVRGPKGVALPQSHFPIRVSSVFRDKMCDFLRGRGIDTSTLFPFPSRLGRKGYPNAVEAAAEVINLPLGAPISLEEVRMISRCVKEGCLAFGC